MARLLCFRIVGALALVSLAFLLVSLDPFFGAAQVGAGIGRPAPEFSINHFRKGDRLPIAHPAASGQTGGAVWHNLPVPDSLQTEQKVPLGCDPAFSPVTAPALANLYGRCMT